MSTDMREREILRVIGEEIQRPYPESAFPEPPKEMMATAHMALKGVGLTLDAVSASMARHVGRVIAEAPERYMAALDVVEARKATTDARERVAEVVAYMFDKGAESVAPRRFVNRSEYIKLATDRILALRGERDAEEPDKVCCAAVDFSGKGDMDYCGNKMPCAAHPTDDTAPTEEPVACPSVSPKECFRCECDAGHKGSHRFGFTEWTEEGS